MKKWGWTGLVAMVLVGFVAMTMTAGCAEKGCKSCGVAEQKAPCGKDCSKCEKSCGQCEKCPKAAKATCPKCNKCGSECKCKSCPKQCEKAEKVDKSEKK